MSMESGQPQPLANPPEEIKVEGLELKTDETGKSYLYEKDGVRYGGDYLAEPPQEISLGGDELPPAPPEQPHPAL